MSGSDTGKDKEMSTIVALYWVGQERWYTSRGEDGDYYSDLCRDCAGAIEGLMWIGDHDEYGVCDICGAGGQDDWESEE